MSDNTLPHYDVLIATPGAQLHASYVRCLVETLIECEKRGISYKWLNANSSLVHNARELTATNGLNNELHPDDKGPLGDSVTYNKIFWIDSDISWSVDDFFTLYDAPEQVIGGAYLLADGHSTPVHTQDFPYGLPSNVLKTMKDIIEVQSIGFGFIAVKSGVFESIERPWFAHIVQQIQNSRGEILQVALGEDISWCVRVANAKIPIYLNPAVLVTHWKTVPITW